MWIDFRESRTFSFFFFLSLSHSILPFLSPFSLLSFLPFILWLLLLSKERHSCALDSHSSCSVTQLIPEVSLSPNLVASWKEYQSRNCPLLPLELGQGWFFSNWVSMAPSPLTAKPWGRVAQQWCQRQPLHRARMSLFSGFPIKCHIYFRAYVKNPQMNCKLFSEATGMDKTLTRKYQLAVFGLPNQNQIFSGWVLGIFSRLSWCQCCPHCTARGWFSRSTPPLPSPSFSWKPPRLVSFVFADVDTPKGPRSGSLGYEWLSSLENFKVKRHTKNHSGWDNRGRESFTNSGWKAETLGRCRDTVRCTGVPALAISS